MQPVASAPLQPRDVGALAVAFGRTNAAPTPAPRPAPAIGEAVSFWVTGLSGDGYRQVRATLRVSTPRVLMYVDDAISADQRTLETLAARFTSEIAPRTIAAFGAARGPLTVLNTELSPGLLGYFTGANEVAATVNPFSNERTMIAMNGAILLNDEQSYLATLSHEFQHVLHWQVRQHSPTWFNEGMSVYAQEVNQLPSLQFAAAYAAEPDTSLTNWGSPPSPHYGAAGLFLRYVVEQSGVAPAELIRRDAGNQRSIFSDVMRQRWPEMATFGDVVAAWAVANYLNDGSVAGGRYAYGAQQRIGAERLSAGEQTVAQYGADYIRLPAGTTTFRGATSVPTLSATPQGQRSWWSIPGDDSVATLTRTLDLRNARSATLQFDAWYNIEADWDYAYVSISTDNGTSWQALELPETTSTDLHGNNIGQHGLTGASGGWRTHGASLNAYAGQQVMLRFWMITDEATPSEGILLDNIRVEAVGLNDDAETDTGGWQAAGFVRVEATLPQQWELRLITSSAAGTTVQDVTTDANGSALLTVPEGANGVLVVLGASDLTAQPARYELANR